MLLQATCCAGVNAAMGPAAMTIKGIAYRCSGGSTGIGYSGGELRGHKEGGAWGGGCAFPQKIFEF